MKYLLTLLFALFTCQAQANVTYTWHTSPGMAPTDMVLKLTFTDAIVQYGSLTLNSSQAFYQPDNGLISLYYGHPDTDIPIVYRLNSTTNAGNGFDFSFQFLPDGSLSGYLSAGNMSNNIAISSAGNSNIFTITDILSETGMASSGCTAASACLGATGYFDSEVTGTDLPEPGSLALALIGLAGFIRARRRQE